MCDTLGAIGKKSMVFGKNSDRDPKEPQVTEWRPAQAHSEKKVKCTYIEVDQATYTHGTLLSRPSWLWGGEIGMNDQGVIIGNEALFSTNEGNQKEALIGMDLLRLGLERGDSAKAAMDVILEMLEQYGQGGNCGYLSPLYYDNAFLIMDRKELYVLETVGKQWAYKKMDKAAISNCFSIKDDADAYSGARCDFSQWASPLEPEHGGFERRCLSQRALAGGEGIDVVFRALRSHEDGFNLPIMEKNSRNVCLHAASDGGSQSTASWAADFQQDRVLLYVTGGAMPCVSLYKPYVFDSAAIEQGAYSLFDQASWEEHDAKVTALAQQQPPAEFYAERDALEQAWRKQAQTLSGRDNAEFLQACLEEEKQFYQKWVR